MHCRDYLLTASRIAKDIDPLAVEAMANELYRVRGNDGRVFVIGMGGSLANAIHFAADLRKLCNIDARCPSNISEFSARANDEGLQTVFTGWMGEITEYDCVFVLSVGGGTTVVSTGITEAVRKAKEIGASVVGIVGPHGGQTAACADCVVQIPAPADAVTPHTEAFQAVIWHALVSHPILQMNKTKW